MPRTVRDARLETRAARGRLASRNEPYWRSIAESWHLGYYKGRRDGTWIARYRPPGGAYKKRRLGRADDVEDANGASILDYKQAQDIAREWFREAELDLAGRAAEVGGHYSVRQAMADYLEWFRGEKNSIRETDYATRAFILPGLGDIEVGKLTTQDIRAWHRNRAAASPRIRTRRGIDQQHRKLDSDDPEAVRRRRGAVGQGASIPPHCPSVCPGENQAASQLSCIEALLRQSSGHGWRAAAGGRAEPRACGQSNGRETLRAPGAGLGCREDPGGGAVARDRQQRQGRAHSL